MKNIRNYTSQDGNQWRSYNNIPFYESLPAEELIKASHCVGLDTYCDLKLIEPYLKHTSSILEIGAGCGRVISYIINSGYVGEFSAIERSKKFFDYLKNKAHTNLELIQGDIVDYSFNRKFDLILWLWAGFIEFSHEEQKALFIKLVSLLNKGGTVIIDSIPLSFRLPNSSRIGKQNYIFHLPQALVPCYCYIPSIYDFFCYAALSSLKYDQAKLYVTTKNRQRVLHIFTKEGMVCT